jgi:hypothetical protein
MNAHARPRGPDAAPHEWSRKSTVYSESGSRVYYNDGRITDFEDAKPIGPAGAEVDVWSSAQDWRSRIEVAIQVNQQDVNLQQQMQNAVVRLYARTAVTRSLIKQGRYAVQGTAHLGSRLVLRASGAPCDEYIVTVQPVSSPASGSSPPKISVAMHGMETYVTPDIRATTSFNGANGIISTLPSFLYGFYASLDSSVVGTRYLWLADIATGTPGLTDAPIVPPIAMVAGQIASLALVDDAAVQTFTGLFAGFSTTYGPFTASGDGGVVNVVYT